jgi:hypothetical protein
MHILKRARSHPRPIRQTAIPPKSISQCMLNRSPPIVLNFGSGSEIPMTWILNDLNDVLLTGRWLSKRSESSRRTTVMLAALERTGKVLRQDPASTDLHSCSSRPWQSEQGPPIVLGGSLVYRVSVLLTMEHQMFSCTIEPITSSQSSAADSPYLATASFRWPPLRDTGTANGELTECS